MKRKGMGKRIAAAALAVTMSISMVGFQAGSVKAETTEPTTQTTETTEPTTEQTTQTTETTQTEGTTKTHNTAVNFYIQLGNVVMDTYGDIKARPQDLFSGSVAKSTMNADVSTDLSYAGTDTDNVDEANSHICGTYLDDSKYIEGCPSDEEVLAKLREDEKTKKALGESKVETLTTENYTIRWYVVKYHDDGWHIDGVLQEKTTENTPETTPDPEPTNPEPTNPESTEPDQNPDGTTPDNDPGTVEIPDDDTPLSQNPDNDVETPSDDDEDVTEILDEHTPLSDGSDIEENDDDVTIIDDEDTPLSDNPLTGDSASTLWAVLAMISAFGLLAVFATGKRKKED